MRKPREGGKNSYKPCQGSDEYVDADVARQIFLIFLRNWSKSQVVHLSLHLYPLTCNLVSGVGFKLESVQNHPLFMLQVRGKRGKDTIFYPKGSNFLSQGYQ